MNYCYRSHGLSCWANYIPLFITRLLTRAHTKLNNVGKAQQLETHYAIRLLQRVEFDYDDLQSQPVWLWFKAPE
jgi:hypothetical protein